MGPRARIEAGLFPDLAPAASAKSIYHCWSGRGEFVDASKRGKRMENQKGKIFLAADRLEAWCGIYWLDVEKYSGVFSFFSFFLFVA